MRLLIDEPTQGGDSAARIYEMEVRGLDKEITLPPVYTEKISTAVLEYAIELAERADTDGVVAAVKENFDTALNNARDVLAQVESGSAEVTQSGRGPCMAEFDQSDAVSGFQSRGQVGP